MRFDPFTDAAIADPYPDYAALRAADPVHWSEKLRAWVLFGYDDVAAVLRDDIRFSADRRRASRAARPGLQPTTEANLRTISSDPPDCLVVRAILNVALVPRVRAIAPRIDAIVEELAAGLAGRTEVDLVADFAHPRMSEFDFEVHELGARTGRRGRRGARSSRRRPSG